MRTSLCAAVAMLALTAAVSAENYASDIADGGGWTVTAPNGREMTLTLSADGTGQMHMGILRRGVTWRESGDAICLDGMPGGERCIAFAPTEGGGFAGTGPDGQQMVLRR